MLERVTEQSWVFGPVFFTVPKTTKTLENSAEKLTSTFTPHGKDSRVLPGSALERKKQDNYMQFMFNLTDTIETTVSR